MATIQEADQYISTNVIDNTDWVEAEPEKKQRILNVSHRTLTRKYPRYQIPDPAIFELASTLATVFNDTNKLQNQGVAGFAITGVGSFTFKENNVRNAAGLSLEDFITQEVRSLVGEANGIELGSRNVKVVVM
ncbi:hypothetical protein SAMN04487866_10960 [Thermoactinomyces sp. DSM 45891]|uniref:hypothetical protein n=1 Tax=Thermoactinomyces sp. DSM 45891 TaxID=1761907 RepID=UPI000922120A|nr:hypothetical protein [Thermoactinomyces sp. DSM 45891]SFX48677.1 hypothetical protein SAMN04487866_10960 [Thermoactinomyces sp. DSM 45891]